MKPNYIVSFRAQKTRAVRLLCLALLAVFTLPLNSLAEIAPELWQDIRDGGYGHDFMWGVAIDSQRNVIAAGYFKASSTPQQYDQTAYMIKYPADGGAPWIVTLEVGPRGPGGKADSTDTFMDVAVDSQDNMIVVGKKSGTWTGYSMGSYHQGVLIRKYKPDGALLWEKVYQDGANSPWQGGEGVATDLNDNIYVAAGVYTDSSIASQWAILKYDKDGNLQSGFPVRYNFSSSSDFPDQVFSIAVDKDGNFIAVGVRGVSVPNRDWHVRKYDPNRNLVWEDTYDGPNHLYDYAYDVAVDSKGDVFVVGYTNKGTDNSTNLNYDGLVIKYKRDKDPGGQQRLWTGTFESPAGGNEACYGVVVDPQDNILVGGYVGGTDALAHWRLEHINGETGDLMDGQTWASTQHQVIYGLAYRNRRIAACGYESNGTNNDMRAAFLVPPPPVITLLGDDPMTIEVGTPYVEPGYTANDDFEGNLTANVVVTGSVDHNVVASYTLRYNVSTASGDPADEKTRTVNVADTTSPVITLLGANPMTLEAPTPYAEPGYTASDNYDGDIKANVVVTGSVNPTVLGNYTLRYNVKDSSGNPAEEKTRTVKVVDTTAPVITLSGASPMALEVGTPYVEPGFTATDSYEGNLTGRVAVSGSVNNAVLGVYILRYNVSDLAGNPAQEKTRTVNVVDTTAPVITLLGDNPMTIEMGTPYVEPGCNATDNYDGNITEHVEVTGSVDHTVPGTYTRRYNVRDSSSNPAQEKIRTVNVVDTTPVEVIEIIEPFAGMIRLTWTSRPADNFIVWSRADMVEGSWFQEANVSSSGESKSWIDPDAPSTMKFYRIERK